MKRLRIAMNGAGSGRGQSWMSTLAKLTEAGVYEFCAVSEVIPERALASSQKWGVKAYPSLGDLLDSEQVDVVLNGTPPDCNVVAAVLAARRGVHAMVEIPIAPTLGIARYMMKTAEDHHVRLEVCEQVWLWAKEQLKRKIIDAGLIGGVTHARLYYTNKADYHGINGARMLVRSRARRVLGYTQKIRVPTFQHWSGVERSEDRWDHAVIEFESGVTCLFSSPPRARMTSRWDVEGTAGQLVGDTLSIGSHSKAEAFPFVTEFTEVRGKKVLDHIRVDTRPALVFENPHKTFQAEDGDEVARMDLLMGMHRAVTQGGALAHGPDNACQDIEILLAMRESANRGNTWVDLPLTEQTALEKEMETEFRRRYGHAPHEVEALTRVAFRQWGVRNEIANWD